MIRQAKKPAPPAAKADNEPQNDQASDDSLSLTLGSSPAGKSPGFGPDGLAHKSRAAGNDPNFVVSPQPEPKMGDVDGEVYPLPNMRTVGTPQAKKPRLRPETDIPS